MTLSGRVNRLCSMNREHLSLPLGGRERVRGREGEGKRYNWVKRQEGGKERDVERVKGGRHESEQMGME